MLERLASASGSQKRRTLAFVLWLCVVWGHSLMPGPLSSEESSRFVFLVRPFFLAFGCDDEALMTFFIRKTAHFSEYAILIALAYRMAKAWFQTPLSTWGLVLGIWVLAPVLDECIQLLTPGRAGMLRDVLIDMAGGLLGMMLAHVATKGKVPS